MPTLLTTNHQRDRASPVLGGKPSRSTRFTTNPQPPTKVKIYL
ncbi:MAG: hypothetical protein ACHBN1_24450 [Heteroscytonema crispum UTEX LB 1556]